MKPLYTAIVTLVASCAFLHDVHAATVTYTQDDSDYTIAPTSSFNPAPASTMGVVYAPGTSYGLQTGEAPDQWRSPFENVHNSAGATALSDGGYGVGDWASLAYTSIQGGGSATYNFSSSDILSILWGSPDSWNTLTFWSAPGGTGTDLYSITGNSLDLQTYGHDLVVFTMTGGTFESVVLTSSQNAFEFADLQAQAPLPAALPLFAGGLGLVGLLARRSKRKNATASAAA